MLRDQDDEERLQRQDQIAQDYAFIEFGTAEQSTSTMTAATTATTALSDATTASCTADTSAAEPSRNAPSTVFINLDECDRVPMFFPSSSSSSTVGNHQSHDSGVTDLLDVDTAPRLITDIAELRDLLCGSSVYSLVHQQLPGCSVSSSGSLLLDNKPRSQQQLQQQQQQQQQQQRYHLARRARGGAPSSTATTSSPSHSSSSVASCEVTPLLSAKAAEQRLQNTRSGAYLLRTNGTDGSSSLILSVHVGRGEVRHINVSVTRQQNAVYIDEKRQFADLPALIAFYSNVASPLPDVLSVHLTSARGAAT